MEQYDTLFIEIPYQDTLEVSRPIDHSYKLIFYSQIEHTQSYKNTEIDSPVGMVGLCQERNFAQ